MLCKLWSIDNARSYDKTVIQTVSRNFYVDNLLKSVPTEEAIKLTYQLMDLLRRGGFRLTKWISNSLDVMAALPNSELATPLIDLAGEGQQVQRAVGVS